MGALLSIAVWVAPASAQSTPEEALSEVREMALYARYREALEAAQSYLERDDLDAAQRNAGLEVLATVHVAMGNSDAVAEVLRELYARDPEHRLSDPDASPPVLSAFGRARANPPEPVAVSLDHEPPTLEPGQAPRVEVQLGEGSDALTELRLRYRRADEARFNTVVMNRGEGAASARLPFSNEEEEYEVVYFIEGLAPSGARLATLGSADEPLAFTMPEAEVAIVPTGPTPTPGGGEDEGGGLWWIGVVAGVVVVGAVLATVLVVTAEDGPQDGSLGNIDLPLVSF